MSEYRAGFVAVIGEPNAGKSTLLNALIGAKLSIVTRKPQTTRRRVLGILSAHDSQLIFLDTPGLLRPRYELQSSMMRSVHAAVSDADIIVVLEDATKWRPDRATLDPQLYPVDAIAHKPSILALNKVDALKSRELILPQIQAYHDSKVFREIIPISARDHVNLDALLTVLRSLLPVHERYYPDDALSDQQQRFFVAEIIRERLFNVVREEVPYASEVTIVEFKERERGKWFIAADIWVERPSQKKILIGAGGATVKTIGERARQGIEAFLEQQVFLELHVRVKEDWRGDKAALREFGYE